MALIIDCRTRELLGWYLSRSGTATTATRALVQALMARFRAPGESMRRYCFVLTMAWSYQPQVHPHGAPLRIQQQFITPHCPQQNGMIERVIRSLKERCVHRHRFESQHQAMRVIGDWIGIYNHRRLHQALGMKTPAEAYALAA